MKDAFIGQVLHGRRSTSLIGAAIFIFVLAVIDWRFEENVSFGFLYLFPMLMVGGHLRRRQIAAVAVLCTVLTETFDPFPWVMPVGLSRSVLTFVAFLGAGLYGFESARGKRRIDEQLGELARESEARRRVEEQMNALIASSPASIFTLDADGCVQLANEAVHRLFEVENGKLKGQAIGRFLPALANVPSAKEAPFFHTEMECRARKQNGEMFLAHVFFSTYQTMSGPRLAAVLFDASDELRDRAEFNLQQILNGSKVLVGALCHEIRNLSGAIGMIHSKLASDKQLAATDDFRALGSLVQALEQMVGLELRQTTASAVLRDIDVRSVLDELKIIIERSFQESEISLTWSVADSVPRVKADYQLLLQAFLNITKNAQRAMETQPFRTLNVKVSAVKESVVIGFSDTGGGVRNPEQLFAPFQLKAQEVGLGLYLSRTFVRTFGGDIHYEPAPAGSCFAVTLEVSPENNSHSPSQT